MKINLLLLFLFAAALCQAQTKVIAHKSHSGTKHTFSKAYKNKLFDSNHSNFGLPDDSKIVVIDSIIAIDEATTLIKMRETKKKYHYGTDYKKLKASDFESKSKQLIDHDLLFKNNSLEIIVQQFRKHQLPIPFANPIKEIVFKGFKE